MNSILIMIGKWKNREWINSNLREVIQNENIRKFYFLKDNKMII
jgi:hypothetical protein